MKESDRVVVDMINGRSRGPKAIFAFVSAPLPSSSPQNAVLGDGEQVTYLMPSANLIYYTALSGCCTADDATLWIARQSSRGSS